MLFLSALLLLTLSAGVVAVASTLEAGGPFVITNVHTGLVIDLFDKYMEGPTPVAANYLEGCLTASQMWYTSNNLASDGAIRMANGHYPGSDMWIFAEGEGLLASTGSVDAAAPVVFEHLPGNVTVIMSGGRAVTSGREPGEKLKLATPRAHDERQQWRFTLLY